MTSEYRLGTWALTWRYLLALTWALPSVAESLAAQDLLREAPLAFYGFLALEVLAVGVAVVLIRFRRRAPILVAVLLSVLSAVMTMLVGFASWAIISLCTRRRWKEILPTGAVVISRS